MSSLLLLDGTRDGTLSTSNKPVVASYYSQQYARRYTIGLPSGLP